MSEEMSPLEKAREAVMRACGLNPYNSNARQQADEMITALVQLVTPIHRHALPLSPEMCRLVAAGSALQGLLANPGRFPGSQPVTAPAADAVAIADALLAALDAPKGGE